MLAAVPEILAHRAAGVGRDVLKRGRLAGSGANNDGVLHRAVLFKGLDNAGNRGPLLAYRNVYADDVAALLVDDGIDADGGLACLTVADDELSLAPSDRDHGIDCLDSGLHRLVDRRPVDDAGCDNVDDPGQLRVDRAFAVDRLADSVDYTSHHLGTDRDRHDLAGPLYDVAFLDKGVFTEKNGTDHVLFKVKRHSVYAVGEFEEFGGHAVIKAVNPRDTVTDARDNANLADIDALLEIRNLFLQVLADLLYFYFHLFTPL